MLGKKSVRAMFKLHPKAIERLSTLASKLGIKQKSLLDYLIEDEDALHEMTKSILTAFIADLSLANILISNVNSGCCLLFRSGGRGIDHMGGNPNTLEWRGVAQQRIRTGPAGSDSSI